MPLDQAGPAVIAHENSKNGAFVAIKRLRINRKPISKVPDFHCNNIVNIKDIFLEADDEIVIVYEQMDVSLRHIKAVTSGPLQAFEIAAICKDVVDGLFFVHQVLNVYIDNLDCSTILVNREGKVKIANIGDSILQENIVTDERSKTNIQRIGSIMIELMDSAASILDPNSTVLTNPEMWRDQLGVKDFLAATQRDSLPQLKKHTFLPPDSNGSCLVRHVFAAVRVAHVQWGRPILS